MKSPKMEVEEKERDMEEELYQDAAGLNCGPAGALGWQPTNCSPKISAPLQSLVGAGSSVSAFIGVMLAIQRSGNVPQWFVLGGGGWVSLPSLPKPPN